MYISVGSGESPSSNFTIESLIAERSPSGQPFVEATVHNTGGLALDMSGTLRLLAGPGGISAGPFAAGLGTTLAIGDTEPVTIELDRRLPAGPWDARITLQSGLLRRSAQATITFPKSGAAGPVKTRSISTFLVVSRLHRSCGSGVVWCGGCSHCAETATPRNARTFGPELGADARLAPPEPFGGAPCRNDQASNDPAALDVRKYSSASIVQVPPMRRWGRSGTTSF